MQRLDGHYLYTLGKQLQPLLQINYGAPFGSVLSYLFTAESALDGFLHNSIYRPRHSLQSGGALLSWIKHILNQALISDLQDLVKDGDLTSLRNSLSIFEANLASEMGLLATYLVAKKGGYDTSDLIDNGIALFQDALQEKVPSAVTDIKQATRCIAFEVPTAAGFHLHRANESVLHAYYDAVRGPFDTPKERNMGVYLAAMVKNNIGDERVRAALKDIKNLHRNPLIHPDHSLQTVDEAIDLLGAIRSAVGAMLPSIPSQHVQAPPQPSSITIPAPPLAPTASA